MMMIAMRAFIFAIVLTVGNALVLEPSLLKEEDAMFNYMSGGPYQDSESRAAMKAAGITCSDVSYYGAMVPKIPQWVVKLVSSLKNKTAKTLNYNFQGASCSPDVSSSRLWAITFAKDNFNNNSIFISSDAPANYTPLGAYDKTKKHAAYRPKDNLFVGMPAHFDYDYFKFMVASNFTLCPGGDHPWSMRFYEAILAGSIPVITRVEADLSENTTARWFSKLGYRWFTSHEVLNISMSKAELKSIADENYKLFLRYQTFVLGDKVPPAYQKYKKTCDSNPHCRNYCHNHLSPRRDA